MPNPRETDIVELLLRNPDADHEAIRATCMRYSLKGFDELMAEALALDPNRDSGLKAIG